MQRPPRPTWKQFALLVILLSHTVFGLPALVAPLSYVPSVSNAQLNNLAENNLHTSLNEDEVFGPSLPQRSDRKKRLFLDAGKKAKQAKFLTIGGASAKVAKSAGKSILKAVATFGIKALIFNFLFSKINQVLDFKNRLIKNFETKNREQNNQVLGNKDAADSTTAASSSDNTTVENTADQIPEFNPEKVSLQVPDTVFGPGFNIANGVSQVFGTIVQNTALRIARLFEALKPILSSSSSFKSKKRDTDFDLSDLHESKTKSNVEEEKNSAVKTPLRNSYVALTQ